MRIHKRVGHGALAMVYFLTTYFAPSAMGVEVPPPFVRPADGGQGPAGAFIDVGGRRTFLHLNLPEGLRVDLSIPSQHGFAQPDTYVMTPSEPEDRPWPKHGAVNGKNWVGIEFSAEMARYGVVDRTYFVIFDLKGGETYKKIRSAEPFAPFFLPFSGYFNPYVAALIKGVAFEKLIRDDVAVMVPYLDGLEQQLLFELLPAINVGYDDLIVVPARYSGAEYFPVRITPEFMEEIIAPFKSAMGDQMGVEVFHHAARFKLDLTQMPLGVISSETLDPNSAEMVAPLRILGTDFTPHITALASSLPGKAGDPFDIQRLPIDGLIKSLPKHKEAARDILADTLVRHAKTVSVSPSEAPGAAAISAIWKDSKTTQIRGEMMTALIEEIDYWQLELKNNERIQYDMAFAALIAAHDPSRLNLSGQPPYFVKEPPAPLLPHLDRILSQEATEDEPLYAQDYYGMAILAGMLNKWNLHKELMKKTTQKAREQIGEMNEMPMTISQHYKALVWGELVDADKNPNRYAEMMQKYERNRARHEQCMKRMRKIRLDAHNLANFANQELHTRVYWINKGVLNCGRRPRPPGKPEKEKKDKEDKKPEGAALKNTRDRIKNFNNIRGLPGKIEGMFKVKAPSSRGDVARFVLKGAKVPIPSGPFDIPERVFNEMLDEILKVWDQAIKALQADPPRPDFHLLEEPEEPVLPEALSEYSEEAREFLSVSMLLAATLQAAVVTFDRLGGAREAGDREWAQKQEIHLEELKYEAGGLLIDVADKIDDQANIIQSIDVEDTTLVDEEVKAHLQQFTQEDFDAIAELTEGLRDLGTILLESY